MLRFLGLVIMLAVCNLAYSQTDADSLIRVAESARGEVRAKAYLEAGHSLYYSNPYKSIPYLEKAVEYARQYQDYKRECEAFSFMGVAHRHLGNYTQALQHFNSQLSVAQQNNVPDEVVWSFINLGNIMIYMKNYALSVEYLDQALRAAGEIGDESVLPYIYVNLGRATLLAQDYGEALKWQLKALELRLQHPDEPVNIVASYRDIGNVYMESGNYHDAKQNFYICLQMLDTMPENGIPATVNMNLANIYFKTDNDDSALYCANEAMLCARRYRNKPLIRDICTVLGDIYFSRGEYAVAQGYYGLQILYNDSIKTSDISRKIYDIQAMTQQYKQESEIESLTRDRSRQTYVFLMLIVMAVAGIAVAMVLHRKRRMINAMVSQLDLQNHQLSESIGYAFKIQNAVIPNFDKIVPYFHDKFMLFWAKETVSGDFYWHHVSDRFEMFAVADTGASGIPGACLGMLGTSTLHQIAETMYDPSVVQDLFRQRVKSLMSGMGKDIVVDYSLMDMSLMVIDKLCNMVFYSGIKTPLVYVRDGKVCLLQPNSQEESVVGKRFVTDMMSLKSGDRIYMLTHGFVDQIGEKSGKPLSYQGLYQLLGQIYDKPMYIQQDLLWAALSEWRGSLPLMDDITIAGFTYITDHENAE